ncbi:aspartate aminotransferase family protein [Actinobacteria bacterium YIM 96077]|uniref:Aspartate aminotransferase family protein n=1 Tax=Phytoactinopolyspora halophila TaxID=1981511 RepID=A0A329QPC0_9ACTN|nr:pyridoxal-dependent decarboxylase [Phytoactinopolyspora halophila]AYY14607.1 aspartate aminotransferase family protein [Actinobacteria bacterium YIM 96077]RAW14016.1 aspartate aminotransferase family protein [Phytoactinopolyspora halophila]
MTAANEATAHARATADFLDGSAAANAALSEAVALMLDTLATHEGRRPCPARSPDELRARVTAIDPIPEDGAPLADVLADVGEVLLAHGVRLADPWCAAHLHPPVLIPAAATELAIGVSNQSMDSYDQAPAATFAEDHLVHSLARLLGLAGSSPEPSGVLTAGGTSSNLLGLLLAREHAHREAAGSAVGVSSRGLPENAGAWRVLASDGAHASVRQATAVLGLGRDAVVPVATGPTGAMDIDALDDAWRRLTDAGQSAIAVVGTAGTTDSGAIDPLDELADRTTAHGAWFHVDAAVGAGLALSDRQRSRLRGIERADSITADLHKLWWQPIGASALLVRDAASLRGVREPADYLNRHDDGDVLNLVERSLDTSRRFDALKVLVSVRATGRRTLGGYVDHLVDLATQAGTLVDTHPDLELVAAPQTVTVLFRCRPASTASLDGGHIQDASDDEHVDALNTRVQRDLLARGRAVIGRTRWRGRVALKLTLVNPLATTADIAALLDTVAAAGRSSQLAEHEEVAG